MKQAIAGAAALCAIMLSTSSAHAINCVAYVKSVTDFNLMGDAWAWWDAASNSYSRGHIPLPGAVMVFSRTQRMHVGHVAVVREIRSAREILIDQANWHHGRVDHGVRVIDTSENNDWSRVSVEWDHGFMGGPFPITGFVYASGTPTMPHRAVPQVAQAHVLEAGTRSGNPHLILAGGRDLGRKPAAAGTHHPAIIVHHPAGTAEKAKPVLVVKASTGAHPAHAAKPAEKAR